MAEGFATDIAKSLLGKLGSFAAEEFCLAWGLEADLARLEERLSAINAVLSDAEKKQSKNDKIRLWLQNLREVLYDAEDVIDEIECETLRRQVVKTTGSTSRKMIVFEDLPATISLPKQLLQRCAECLQTFIVKDCSNIRELPECIGNLKKLQKLQIKRCPILSKRCLRGTGEDWPKIAHIPQISVDDDSGERTSD